MLFKRLWIRAKDGLTSEEAKKRLATVERALELQIHDKHQADVNSQEAATVADLVDSLTDIPSACIRAGSLVVVKFERNGKPEVHARQLSPIEIKAADRYPDLHKRPDKFFESLQVCVSMLEIEAVDRAPEVGEQSDGD